jgi:hypothetical protein
MASQTLQLPKVGKIEKQEPKSPNSRKYEELHSLSPLDDFCRLWDG